MFNERSEHRPFWGGVQLFTAVSDARRCERTSDNLKRCANHPHTQVGEWHAPSKALMPTRGRWGQRTADSIGFSAHSGRANRRHTHRRVGRRRRRREEIFGPRGSFPAGGPCSRTFKTRRPRTCSVNVQNSTPLVFNDNTGADRRKGWRERASEELRPEPA